VGCWPGQGILPGTPDPAEAGTPERRYLDETCNVHQPGGCWPGQGILPGTPDPAEAGTPEWRYPDETSNTARFAFFVHCVAFVLQIPTA
jgi:hypothetical protein